MNLPTQRVTITMAECRLLMLGLNLVGCRLADANSGNFPYRIAWEVSAYAEQAYDAEMSACFIRVRRKLWEMTRSRKIYADTCELAALALALRLCRSRKLIQVTADVSTEIKLLHAKIERYRKRAKRSAIAKLGKLEYSSIAGRWRCNVAWLRCNTLCPKLRRHGKPWRTQRWRDQRQQAEQAIKTALAENFYEALDDKQMTRIVTLLTTTLRRCRYSVGLIGFLRAPQEHTDYLVKFVVKRIEPDRLPGAPVPAWQAASDRADRFHEHQQKAGLETATPTEAIPDRIIAAEQVRQVAAPPKIKAHRPFKHNRQPITEEILIDALATWLFQQVTKRFNLTREVCDQARYQVHNGHLDQYRVAKLAATTLNGVVQELRPTDIVTDAPDLVSAYAGWLLGILLALRQHPAWIYGAIETIGTRAVQREQQARNDAWTARILDRS